MSARDITTAQQDPDNVTKVPTVWKKTLKKSWKATIPLHILSFYQKVEGSGLESVERLYYAAMHLCEPVSDAVFAQTSHDVTSCVSHLIMCSHPSELQLSGS